MSFKTFDYICINTKCKEYNIKQELLVKDKEKDSQVCKYCSGALQRGFSMGAIKTADNNGRLN